MEIVSSILLEVAIGKSAELLLEGLRSSEMEELHQKLDAILLGDFRAACRFLTDSERSSKDRDAMLLDGLRLFEISAGRFDVLVEKRREQLFPNILGRIARSFARSCKGVSLYGGPATGDEERQIADALALEDLLEHLNYEHGRLLCYIGALRVSLLLDSEALAPLKRERVESVAAEIRTFFEEARARLKKNYDSRRLEKRYRPDFPNPLVGKILEAPLSMLQRTVVGWAKGETYEQYGERLSRAYADSMRGLGEWESIDLPRASDSAGRAGA